MLFELFLALCFCNAIAIPAKEIASSSQESGSSELLKVSKNKNAEHYEGFISYRRSASRHLAMLIKVMLTNENVSAYLDVEDLEGGPWDPQLIGTVRSSPNFILILSNGTLERCKGDFNYTDVMHQEIKEAVGLKKRIIPVFDFFDWPASKHFSKEINKALSNQGIDWVHHLVEQSLERLISYMANGPSSQTR